jgi:hypothetical protein
VHLPSERSRARDAAEGAERDLAVKNLVMTTADHRLAHRSL